LKQFLISRGVRFANELHPSLNNQDKWEAMIHKQRLLNYPYGRDIIGIKRQNTSRELVAD